MTVIRLSTIFVLFASMALCQVQPKLTVQGIDGQSLTLSSDDFGRLPQQRVKTSDHGNPATFEGVLLSDVLAKVRTPTGEAFHKTAASNYVLAGASDGYRAVFAWAEVDPTFTDRKVYVATKRDGKALSERDGPFQLVAPEEMRGARWVRQLNALKLEAAPTTDAYDSAQARWIAASLMNMATIQVGITRRELLNVFMEEGGISTQAWRRYVYRKCPYIKVDVEFAPAAKPTAVQNPDDRITKISKPFLEFAIAD